MTPSEYHDAAIRTLKPRGWHFDLNHSILGLTTEMGELATNIKRNVIYGKDFTAEMKENIFEELGDVMWYIPCGLQAVGRRFEDVAQERTPTTLDLTRALRFMALGAGNVNIHVPLYPDNLGALRGWELVGVLKGYESVVDGARAICAIMGWDFGKMLEANINKLKARYPTEYTSELAEARLDKGGVEAGKS